MTAGQPTAQTFRCSHCGAPFDLRGGPRTQVIVCAYCDSATDLTDPSLRTLWRYEQKVKHPPTIPLGASGRLAGKRFDCIGYMRRSTVVEGETYTWSEYLLYNPYKGYRWLVEDEGLWTVVQVSNALPTRHGVLVGGDPPPETLEHCGRRYEHIQTSVGRVDYVIGEFYWAVSVGDSTANSDYRIGNHTLSAEVADDEITWSTGENISRAELFKAFHLDLPSSASVSRPVQPDTLTYRDVWVTWLLYCLLAIGLTTGFTMFSKKLRVVSKSAEYTANARERSFVTDIFEIPGARASNVEVTAEGNLDNRWCAYHVSLINDDTGDAHDVGIETSWYHGVEDGESWTEGSSDGSARIAHVQPGRYYLFIEPESGTGNEPETFRADQPTPGPLVFSYTVAAYSDVVDWRMLGYVLLLMLPCPFWMTWRVWRRSNP